ncbi:MAG: SH3 domain-containing protein [Thermomicrobiales bacterium]|nr:SH3 domain-containing protein [Thermomicrobiales bacterium]MCO5217848.1 SH3 domain-containing protein [Thermomicrobiales bacterium]MCO5223896.1 SH3 domain-containing protein [Thermomicrobiales bacterium]MCO5227459.1 SH3 domain-containing protein [Thermomicrobiales bacterium]
MGTCSHSSHHRTPRWLAKNKLDRRTILKASGAFTAAAALAHAPSLRPSSSAQSVTTLAQEWVQPDSVGGENGALGFETSFPFYAIAPHWPQESDNNTTIEISTSMDGLVWSSPAVVGPAHTDAGPADKDNRVYGQLAFTDESNFVRYRALDPDGNEQVVPGLTFTYIDATGGPSLDDISTSSPVPSLQRPPIISREEWGANLTYGGAERGASEWIPEYQTVEHVIIHHSETSNFRDPLTEIRSIHYYHAITRGWGDIGYNYLVDFMGNVYEGRVGGDNVVGGHAYQYAYGSAGICVMGSFSVATATPEMLAGLTWITAWAGRYLDPLARSDFHEQPNLPTICAHRDVNDSSCPGDSMYADLDYIREAVAEVLAGTRDTIPDPDYSPGQVVSVVVDSANVRELPGTGNAIVISAPWGSIFQIIEGPATVDSEQWYRVRGVIGGGWIAQSTFGPSDAAPPAGAYDIGETLYVSQDLVNLRDQPSLRGTIVGSVNFTDEVTITDGPMPANGYTWYKVESTGGNGWITERYLSYEEDLAKPARLGVGDEVEPVEPDGVALRANPSPDASRLLGLPYGTRGTVIEGPVNARGYNWIKVQTAIGTGWGAEEYFDLSTADEDPEPNFIAGDAVIVDTDHLNVRESPSAIAHVVFKLSEGDQATVLRGPEMGNNMAWYELEANEGIGWAVGAFLTSGGGGASRPSLSIGDAVYITTDDVNLRVYASVETEIASKLNRNTSGTVLDGPEKADGFTWYHIQTGDQTGWVSSQYLARGYADPASVGYSKGTGVTTADGEAVNVRQTAGANATVVAQIKDGDIATVGGGTRQVDGYTWIQVNINGVNGWVAQYFITPSVDAAFTPGTKVHVIDGELNLRDVGSLAGEIVAVLPDATYCEIVAGPELADGYTWYKVSTSRYGSGWAVADFLRR